MSDGARETCPHLFQLLGAYLHQDFDLDHGTADDALTVALAENTHDRLVSALEELHTNRPAGDDELASRGFVNALCDYHPPGDGLSYVQWLDHVDELLRAATGT